MIINDTSTNPVSTFGDLVVGDVFVSGGQHYQKGSSTGQAWCIEASNVVSFSTATAVVPKPTAKLDIA